MTFESLPSTKQLLSALGASAAVYGVYKATRPDPFDASRKAQRAKDAEQIAAWRNHIFSSEHWTPLLEYAGRNGVKLVAPPAGDPSQEPIAAQPYSWYLTARILNFLSSSLPYSVLDESFLPKKKLLSDLERALHDTPAVACLGGQRTNQLVHDRLTRLWVGFCFLDGAEWV
jgi:hypothetical protein